MNMIFERKLSIPMEVKEMYPLTHEMLESVEKKRIEIKMYLKENLTKSFSLSDLVLLITKTA